MRPRKISRISLKRAVGSAGRLGVAGSGATSGASRRLRSIVGSRRGASTGGASAGGVATGAVAALAPAVIRYSRSAKANSDALW